MERTHDFRLDRIDDVSYACTVELDGMYKLSPFVWHAADHYELLLRVVNKSDIASEKIARIHRGISLDGVNFALGAQPVIAPGEDVADSFNSGGCEDPTVAVVDGEYFVYYTGWNERMKRGELLLASGPDLEHLTKRGIALPSTPAWQNPKEAEIVRAGDGSWRLFSSTPRMTDRRSASLVLRASMGRGAWRGRCSKRGRAGTHGI